MKVVSEMLDTSTRYFPTPAAHAIVILDEAKGKLDDAIALVALNVVANPLEFDHWLHVLRALDGGAEA